MSNVIDIQATETKTDAPADADKPVTQSAVFSMFGGGAKKEKKEEEDRGDTSGSNKAQREAAAAAASDEKKEGDVRFTTCFRCSGRPSPCALCGALTYASAFPDI